MKIEIKRMYDAVKAIEVEELKKKLEAVGGEFEFEDLYLVVTFADSDGEEHDAYVEKVFMQCGKPFLSVRYDGGDSVTIDCECVAYGHLSCVTDEIKYPRSVWARVGCVIYGTKEQMDCIMGVEEAKLKIELEDMFDNGQVKWSGCSYIPQDCIESYNEEYGENIEVGDIDLD